MDLKTRIGSDGKTLRYLNGKPVITETPTHRKCSFCKVVKELTDFYLDGSRPVLRGRGYKCKDCSRAGQRKHIRTPHGQYICAKAIVRHRGHRHNKLTFDLSFEEYTALRKKPCHYCGGPLPETGMGLDRRDNGEVYNIETAVPCCDHCNRIKCDVFTEAEAMRFGAIVATIRAERAVSGVPLKGKTHTDSPRGGGPRKHFPKDVPETPHA